MRFFETFLAGAALVAAAWAVELNNVPSSFVAGQTVTFTYSPKDNTPTTFILRKGDPNNLDTIGEIGTATGGSFTWTVPKDLVNAPNYAIEVQQAGSPPNYSGLIPLTGGKTEDSSSSASSSGYPTKTPSSTPSASSASSTTKGSSSSKVTPSASASGTGSMTTPGMNSTITTATLSRTSTSGSSGPTTTGPNSPPQQSGNGADTLLGSSPMALLVGAAAMVYFN